MSMMMYKSAIPVDNNGNYVRLWDELICLLNFASIQGLYTGNIFSSPNVSTQGSKFVVAMVANATMFSHLLPGCSCGSKHLLLP